MIKAADARNLANKALIHEVYLPEIDQLIKEAAHRGQFETYWYFENYGDHIEIVIKTLREAGYTILPTVTKLCIMW